MSPISLLTLPLLSTITTASLHRLVSRHAQQYHHPRSMEGQKILPPDLDPAAPIIASRPSPNTFDFDATSTKRTANLELDMWPIFGMPFYITNIAIGNPPQPFQMMLDLDWDGLLARSSACNEPGCGGGNPHFTYNHSASATYKATHEEFYLSLPAHHAYGNLSYDELFLVSAIVPGMVFGEVDKFHGENWLLVILADLCDGAMGLGPPNASAYTYPPTWNDVASPHPNFFHQIISSKALERNTMLFHLPQQHGKLGKLVLGEELPSADISIPLINKYDSNMGSSWNAHLTNLAVRGNSAANYSFEEGVFASFALSPFINLPIELAEQIWSDLGAERSDMVDGATVPCDRKDSLPDLVFTLGGEEVIFSKREYSAHAYYGDGQEICWVKIVDNEYQDDAMIHLGMAMLREWDFFIDVDGSELGCEYSGRVFFKRG